jgi:hypothetical protein
MRPELQARVFGFSLLQDRNVWVGVFPVKSDLRSWSGPLGTTNTFVFALRLGSWALTLSKRVRKSWKAAFALAARQSWPMPDPS